MLQNAQSWGQGPQIELMVNCLNGHMLKRMSEMIQDSTPAKVWKPAKIIFFEHHGVYKNFEYKFCFLGQKCDPTGPSPTLPHGIYYL